MRSGSIETALRAGVQGGFCTDLLGETHPAQSKEFALRPNPEQRRRSTVRDIVNADLLQRFGLLAFSRRAHSPTSCSSTRSAQGPGVLGGQGEQLT